MKAKSQGGKCFGFGEHSLKYTEFFSLGYILGEMFNYSWFYVELRVESIFLDRHLLHMIFKVFSVKDKYRVSKRHFHRKAQSCTLGTRLRQA